MTKSDTEVDKEKGSEQKQRHPARGKRYTNALKKKILEMYPEIEEHHISVGLDFDTGKNAYIVSFKRGDDELKTLIEKKDADECMDGIKCVYLGVQVAQFIKNFEERLAFKNKAA